MIFSTITQNNLNLTADTTEIPAQYSNNIQFKFIQDNERFSGYIPTIYIGVYDSAMIECSDVISAGGAVVVDGDGMFAISNEIMYRNGFLAVGVTLTNNDENVSLKPVIYRIQASVGGLSPLPPDVGEWQQVVKAFVETLFNNWSAENLDPIKAQLEELISTAQTQQEKITSQQTQIDNAIGNMGDYEIVQEDPVQIRFKKGDGTFGETVDLGDGLASKAMVNAGYYTYKGISYGGSASNNGIDVAEIDGAYFQETTNGFQLFDASKLSTKSQGGVTVTNNGDGSFTISGSGNLTSNYSNSIVLYSNEEAVKLFKQGTIYLKTEKATTPYFQLSFDGEGSFSLTNNGNSESVGTITQEMLEDVNFRVRLIVYGVSGSTITPATIKPMLYQDGDGTFEPFTGGIASPNPEYPQDPKFVGDYNEDTQKYDIDFMTSGKNLFNINGNVNVDGFSKVQRSSNTVKDGILTCNVNSNTAHGVGQRLYGLKGKTISVSAKLKSLGEATIGNIYIYESSGSYKAVGNTTALDKVFAINNYTCATDDIVVAFAGTGGTGVQLYDIMVNYGAKFVDYEPFTGFETTTVELNQPLRELPNGVKDTIENGIATRRVGEIIFDGSSDESWKKYTGSAKTVHTYMINLDKPRGINDAICDKLVYIQDCWEKDIEFSYSTFAVGRGFYVNTNSEISTVDQFKTWLQSNPITVWYELATPNTEQITLPTLPSWYPYTNALVGTELQPSFVEWHIKTAGANQNDLTVIKEDISQLQTETTQLNDDVTKLMGAFTSVTDLTKQLFLLMHRVGDIIFSTSDENPSTIYGGTWVAWGKGQVPVGVDTSNSDFKTVEKTGGEKEHTLTVVEMPSHTHAQYVTSDNQAGGGIRVDYTKDGTSLPYLQGIDTGSSGENQPHNNLQPYITCYMWKRTA
ncbi:phage baseplate protein [Thomasclavelia ramosa]|uniref:phage baseplate protein n=1 Tax=Thomasclavelia ramosa TaxID=1547 RepID=UPI00344CF826